MLKFKRSKALGCVLAAMVLVAVLASCTKEENNTISNETAPPTGEDGDNLEDDNRIVRIAINTEPDSLDPYLYGAADTESMMMNVFEGLTGADPFGNIEPRLAKSWTVSDDGLNYIFELQENALFHNGKKFTAEDVLFSVKRLAGLDGGKGASSKFSDVTAVEKLSDSRVQITLNSPDASFLSKCMMAMLPEDYNDQAEFPVGTGPYKFVAYNPGQSLKLEINEDYYEESRKGSIRYGEFVFMSDENAKILSMRSGTLDIFDAAQEIVNQLPEEGFTKHHNLSNLVQILALNHDREPFDNKLVRQALNYGIDRDEISLIVTESNGYNIYTTMTPASSWYNKDTESQYTYDPERAVALLAEAGYPDGFAMEITIPSNYLIHVNTGQVIAEQLERIGIRCTLKLVEWGQWYSDVYEAADYHGTITGLSGKIDPHEVIVRFQSDYARNFYHYRNDAYDRCVAEGYQEFDDARRKEIYNEAQMILTEDAAAVFIQDPGSDVVCVEALKGYVSYPVSFWDLSKLYFE